MGAVEGTRHRLLRYLNRYTFRTGTEMGAALGLSRAAVHKHVQGLVEQGVPIHRVPGRGYRLADGITLLDGQSIMEGLSAPARSALKGLEILDEVDSTNSYLAARATSGSIDGRVCLAEKQTSGRGRRGRTWVASPYRDMMMSIGIEYTHWPAQLPTLGLVTALTIVGALAGLGVRGLMVKWPNDVVHESRKLCGILLDVTGEGHGACRIIIGVGINVSVGGEQGRDIDRAWTDLETITGRMPDRNAVASACLDALLPALSSFPADGFGKYRQEWRRLDALYDQPVAVHGAAGASMHGRAAGVDESGQLRVTDERGETRLFAQGDVSVRAR